MGRPRKPDHLKIVEGDREDRINRDAPIPELSGLVPPYPLPEKAMEAWNRLASSMRDKGVLTDWDLDSLAMACNELGMYWTFQELLEERKDDYPEFGPYQARGAQGGAIKQPYHQMKRDALANYNMLMAKFGMTPADRSKLSVRDGEGKVSGLDELIS